MVNGFNLLPPARHAMRKLQSPDGGKAAEDSRTPSKTVFGAQRCWFNWANCPQHDALEGASLAPGTEATLTQLTDEASVHPDKGTSASGG